MTLAGVQKLIGDTSSVTAVEFALIGPVLFFFLFGIVLLGIVQFWQLTLDDAVRNAARQLTIGAASTTGIQSGSGFVTAVCSEFGVAAPNCTTTLQYAIQGAPTFTGNGGITPAALSAAGQFSQTALFSGVTASEPVLIQVVYKLPISIPLVPMSLVTLNGTPAIVSATALVAEP